jgi:O-antigen/teichoic acid export membrane protein
MTVSTRVLLKGTAWTIGAQGLGLLLRLLTNVVMARLLAPDLFGTMLIVYTLWNGIELMTDIGLGQNIVYNKNAEDPNFYNTAWTLGLLRSVVLWFIFLGVAAPAARFYNSPILLYVVPVAGLGILIGGLTPISRSLLQKRLEIARLNAFDLTMSLVSSATHVLFAYVWPTIWALVFGGLSASVILATGTHFMLPEVKQKLHISKQYVWEILHFGKWIFVAQIVYFLSLNFDRLYLAKVVPLELLGIYGIARAIAELSAGLVLRLANTVMFPFIASHSQTPRSDLRGQLVSLRLRFMIVAALGFSLFVAIADLAIKILYDSRYHEATWMLPILIIGTWFSIITNLNEATLLGLGKPFYGAISNSFKFAFLLVGLPLGVKTNGIFGGVMVVAMADLCRYIPILIGQRRERFAFARQDVLVTFVAFSLIGFWEWLRWVSGYGTSFESLPVDLDHFWR